jgi:hypothetical protein
MDHTVPVIRGHHCSAVDTTYIVIAARGDAASTGRMSRPRDFFKEKKKAALLRRINRHCETLAFRDLGFVLFNKKHDFPTKINHSRTMSSIPVAYKFFH